MQRALLMLLVALSYLLLAGGPPWTLAPLGVVAVLTIAVSPRRTLHFPAASRPLDVALLALLTAVAIQLVPLPATVIAWLSPQAAPLRESLRFAISPAQQWQPLSIEPRATAMALACLLLGVAAFLSARAAFAGGGVRQFCKILGVLAAVAAMVAVVQRSVAPRLLMGVIRPEAPNANPMGPFVNRNHFAAWQLMAAAMAAGYIVAHLHIHPAYRSSRFKAAVKRFFTSGALLSGIGVVAMVGALLMTLSRSAAVGLGAAALAAAALARPRLRVERSSLPAVATIAGVGLLLVAGLIDVGGWYSRLQQSAGVDNPEWGRLTIWRESWPMLRDFWLTGTGAGTFSTAMEYYQQSRIWVGALQSWALFNNAHSHYVQVAAEGGLLLSLPAAAVLVLLARSGLAAIRAEKAEIFWVRIGAAAGLVGIAVQSIWEVPLLMPANAVLCGVLAGLLLHKRDVRRSDGVETPPPADKLFE